MIIKTYKIDDLLDDWQTRTSLIEKYIPWVRFKESKGILYRETDYRPGVHKKNGECSRAQLSSLAHKLDDLFTRGIVHGDINQKNVLFNNDEAIVIDWEPSLRQIKNGLNRLISTHPWIDIEDIESKRLTVRTDLVGFTALSVNPNPQYFKSKEWKLLRNSLLQSPRPFSRVLEETRSK